MLTSAARSRHDYPRSTAPDILAPKITIDDDYELLERALNLVKEDQGATDFINRLNCNRKHGSPKVTMRGAPE